MGVRFACHACGKRLNIKSELAGRRGICPSCSVRFRIPTHDTETSTPIHSHDADESTNSVAATSGHGQPAQRVAQASTTSSGDSDIQSGGTAVAQEPVSASALTSPQTRHENGHSNHTQAAQTSPHSAASQPASQPVAPQPTAPAHPSMDDILGDASSTWYVRPPSGGQYGPANGPTLGQWIQEGRVADNAMLWRDGWPDWRIAKEVLPIFGAGATMPNNGSVSPDSMAPVSTPAAAMPTAASATINNDPASDSRVEIRAGGKVLDTNKKRMSRKRVAISMMLACVFVVLLVALILVLKQP